MQAASRVQVYMLFLAVALAACVLFLGMRGAEAEDTSEETHAHAQEHGTPGDHALRLNEDLSLYESLGIESEPAGAATEPVPGGFTTGASRPGTSSTWASYPSRRGAASPSTTSPRRY